MIEGRSIEAFVSFGIWAAHVGFAFRCLGVAMG